MKTNYLLNTALATVLAIGAASCTNELTDGQTPQEGKPMSIIANLPENVDTRLGYDDSNNSKLTLKWKSGDALSVYKTDFAVAATDFTLETSADGTKNGTFNTPSAPGYSDNDNLIAVYPQGNYTGDANGMQLSVTDQSGVLAGSKHHYMYAATQYKAGETPAFAFSHLMAAVKLEMTFSDMNAGDKVKAISLCGNGLFDKAVMSADGSITQATDANEIVSTSTTTEFTLNSEKKVTAYLFVFPTTLSGAKVTATDGSKTYEFKLTPATLQKGYVYRVAATMTEATPSTWYNNGSATDYYIYNLKDLQNFAATVNSAANSDDPKTMKDKNVHLLADIDMGNTDQPTIGKDYKIPFRGTFDGHGKTVSNLNNSSTNGLFGYATNATIKNVTVTGTVSADSNYDIGGIVGGGSGAIIGCVNRANVSGKSYVGGITGSFNGSIIACENFGAVTSTSSRVGGITGNSSGGCIVACINHGNIKTPQDTFAGGISGMLNKDDIKLYACINDGTVAAYNTYGGIVGSANKYSEIKANYFKGSMKFAGEDNLGNGWDLVSDNTYTEINNKVSEMNTAINEWNAVHTDDGLACPYIYQASNTPASALPTLVKQP